MKRGKSGAGSFEQRARLSRACGGLRPPVAHTPLHELEADAERDDLSRSQRRYLARLIRRQKAKTPGSTPKG